jgi:hypothetical protein
VGSQVSAGDPLARLAGVDRYWIETTIPPDKLRWLTFADNGAQDGSRVSIRQRTAWNADQFRSGTLYRLIGELEGNTRLARALVAVDDPLARNTEDPDVPALMIGTYVECLIEGREIRDAFRLRREFVRNDDKVWLMRGGVLAIQPVDVVFRDAEYAYIQDGIEAGDQVVITSLATVKEGVPLRLNQGPSQ